MVGEPRFPIQASFRWENPVKPHPTAIPWSVADLAFSVYAGRYGKGQSLERLAERGGFSAEEMDEFLPDWRERCDALTAANARIQELEKEREENLGATTEEILTDLREELAIAETSAALHAGLNRRAAKALGKPREGTGSSWHDIPECIKALRARTKELEEERDTFERDAVKAHEDLSRASEVCQELENLLRRATAALPDGGLRDEILGTVALAGEVDGG